MAREEGVERGGASVVVGGRDGVLAGVSESEVGIGGQLCFWCGGGGPGDGVCGGVGGEMVVE